MVSLRLRGTKREIEAAIRGMKASFPLPDNIRLYPDNNGITFRAYVDCYSLEDVVSDASAVEVLKI